MVGTFFMRRFGLLLAAITTAEAYAAETPSKADVSAEQLLKSAVGIQCGALGPEYFFLRDSQGPSGDIMRQMMLKSEIELETLCQQQVDTYLTAMAAADGTAATIHRATAGYLKAATIHGRNYIDRSLPEAALKHLQLAYSVMMTHYANGAHAHAVLENIPLVYELHRGFALVGDEEQAAKALANARVIFELATRHHEALKKSNKEGTTAQFMVNRAMQDAYTSEGHLANFWSYWSADRAFDGKVSEAKKARARALDASKHWLRFADANMNIMPGSNGINMLAVRHAVDALQVIAAVQFADGDRNAAVASLEDASKRVCIEGSTSYLAARCEKVTEKLKIAKGQTPGDISPLSRKQMVQEAGKAAIEEDRKTRQALGID